MEREAQEERVAVEQVVVLVAPSMVRMERQTRAVVVEVRAAASEVNRGAAEVQVSSSSRMQ